MLKLKDCRIVDIKTDNYFSSGCPTCDYGSDYTREIDLKLNNGEIIEVRISQMYEYSSFSYGDLMKFILNGVDEFKTKTINEFIEMLVKTVEGTFEKYTGAGVYVNRRTE